MGISASFPIVDARSQHADLKTLFPKDGITFSKWETVPEGQKCVANWTDLSDESMKRRKIEYAHRLVNAGYTVPGFDPKLYPLPQ